MFISSKATLNQGLMFILFFVASCTQDETSVTPTPPTATAEVPAVYKKIYGATSITNDGTYITIKSCTNPLIDWTKF